MESIANKIVNYLIQKDLIDQEEKDICQYGIQIGIEFFFFLLTCILISAIIKTLWECCVTLLIFCGLRSYTGGLHFKEYIKCYLTSCSALISIPVIANHYTISCALGFLLVVVLLIALYKLKPVNNINRHVEPQENTFFIIIRNYILAMIFLVSLILTIKQLNKYISVIIYTLLVIIISVVVDSKIKGDKERYEQNQETYS